MKVAKMFLTLIIAAGLFWLLPSGQAEQQSVPVGSAQLKLYSVASGDYLLSLPVVKTAAQWRQQLSAEQYQILREQGTEPAYSGDYWKSHGYGVYRCAACGLDLYHSSDKYDSKTGWPSFYQPVAPENIAIRSDRSYFRVRNELICARCQSHLGHVFDDGPPPTGQRHCINSAALTFAKLEK